MFLGLRCDKGISKEDFFKIFGVDIESVYGKEIAKLSSQGLIFINKDRICLTSKGFDLANMVFVEFMQ